MSAMVDEVFFILKKCARRALATSSLNAMGHVIMYCHTVLVSTYKDALDALLAATDKSGALELSGGFASLFAGTTVGGQVADLSRRQVVDSFDGTGYNNMEASAANVLKLHGALEQELQQVFKGSARKAPPPPPSRTDWTRLVPPPVLTGHVSSLLPRTRRRRAR